MRMMGIVVLCVGLAAVMGCGGEAGNGGATPSSGGAGTSGEIKTPPTPPVEEAKVKPPAAYEADGDTLHLFHLDDVGTGSAKDSVGVNPAATVVNGTEVEGKFGKALGLDGQGHVATPEMPKVEEVPALTVECWVKFTGEKAGGDVVCRASSYLLRVVNGKLTALLRIDGKWRTVVGTKTLEVGKWTHLAITYDGKTKEAKLYVNGVLDKAEVPEGVTDGKLAFQGTKLKIGVNTWTPENPVKGEIDEVRVSKVVREFKALPE